jgi:RNA polymerase sigma factor (sigma-70 family)
MQANDDRALLREYAAGGSEGAFEALVSRHIGLVYSAALRQVRDSHLAEDITQTVFMILAQKARGISTATILAGWLFKTTRYTALAQLRALAKRQRHEQEVQMETEIESAAPGPLWEQLSPLVDEALATLGEKDRQAVLLRFFENKSLAEVGQRLGATEDTARKRVSRAMEKLHRFFDRRGISSTTAVLAATISAHAVQAAPAMLAKSVAGAALAQAAVAGGSTLILTQGALKLMALTQVKIAAVGALVVGVAVFSVMQHQGRVKLRDENQALRQAMESLQADNAQLAERAARPGSPQAPLDEQARELLRLRGEVGLLRRETNELGNLVARARNPEPRNEPALAEDYPKTPDGATKSIFENWARGDWDAFIANFGEPGVPREVYDKMFKDPATSNYLAGLEIVALGQPTNSFGPNMWFVPYKIRFKDGTEKEFRLHVAQNPQTQRWYFKGGL